MFNTLSVSFSPVHLRIPTENRTKLKKIINLNHGLKWNTSSKKIQTPLDFLSTLVLKDHSK